MAKRVVAQRGEQDERQDRLDRRERREQRREEEQRDDVTAAGRAEKKKKKVEAVNERKDDEFGNDDREVGGGAAAQKEDSSRARLEQNRTESIEWQQKTGFSGLVQLTPAPSDGTTRSHHRTTAGTAARTCLYRTGFGFGADRPRTASWSRKRSTIEVHRCRRPPIGHGHANRARAQPPSTHPPRAGEGWFGKGRRVGLREAGALARYEPSL